MKHLLLLVFLFTACASTAPVINPVTPVVVTPPADTVYLPGKVVHDTTTVYDPIIEPLLISAGYPDTLVPLLLTPSGGDDWPAAQAILNSTGILRFSAGQFKLSQGLIKVNLVNGQYAATWFDIEGSANAQNAISGDITTLNFTNPQSFGIAFQQAKGAGIKNLYIRGPYTGGAGLTQLQIDTLPYWGWEDGICRFNATSPAAGIVEDPFSDRSNFPDTSGMYPGYSAYYFSPMSQSGSTAVQISGVCIENFPVGILITAVNQQNGENNTIRDCRIDQCASAIAFTQAQAKTNYVTNLMSWGQVHTVFDGVHYGLDHGDGSTCPVIDGVNIAGMTGDIFEITTTAFSGSAENVYGEGVFRIGFSGSQFDRGDGFHLIDPQIDFQNGGPSPDYWWHGGGLLITGGHLRFYNNGSPNPSRIVLNDVGEKLESVSLSGPPVVVFNQAGTPKRCSITRGCSIPAPDSGRP